MFGKEPRLSALETEKRLLIAESELNRERLIAEGRELANGIHGFADRAKSVGTVASAVISLVAGVAVFNKARKGPADKSSWYQKLATGASLASSLWVLYRARRPKPDKE